MRPARRSLGEAFSAAALLALLGLGACNVVSTKTPLFGAADEAGAPALRPGVWLVFKQPDCADFDETKPLDAWPGCAGGGVVHPGEVLDHPSDAPAGVVEHTPFIFAAGDPRIAQLVMKEKASVTGSGEGGDVTTSSQSAEAQAYIYAGARPTKTDDQGRIVALTYWPVECGPPPKDKDGEETTGGTKHLLPGLEMIPGEGGDCTTQSIPALRRAAKASEPWTTPLGEAHWVRDGDR